MKNKADENLLIDIFFLPVKRVSVRKPRMDKGFTSKQITSLLEQFKEKISEVSDERNTDDGVWFYLADGLSFDDVHCVHEWDYKAALAGLQCVAKCNCSDCV